MLSISLFGAPHLARDGRALTISRRKNRALLFYIAAHEGALTREHLLSFFFPDHPRSAAQQTLRTMLYHLRAELGEALVAEDETVGLAAGTFVDARVLEEALRTRANAEQLSGALTLYRGDFLDGVSLRDDPEFDDWVSGERERYRALAVRGLARLGELRAERKDLAGALEALERAQALDPLDETVARAAMRVQYMRGDRAGAIRRFEKLRKRLADELGVPPLAETRALYDGIITDTPVAEGRPAVGEGKPTRVTPPVAPARDEPRLPFAGRGAELRAMGEAARAGKAIWITGEPGIGKTRLTEEFVRRESVAEARAPAGRLLVLRGAGHELETALPYQPLVEALRGLTTRGEGDERHGLNALAPVWLGELARLMPELTMEGAEPAGAAADEARVWEALYQALELLGRSERVILVVEDAHWGDAPTIGFLGYLARRPTPGGLTLIVTLRPPAADSKPALLMQTLMRENRLVRIALEGLKAGEVRTIAEQVSPAQAAALAQWLMENGEGNPFFVTELVRYAQLTGLLSEAGVLDETRLGAALLLPPTLQNLIATRLTRLGENPRRVLYVAAVSGGEFEVEWVHRAARMSEEETLDALDALGAAGLILQGEEGRFRFDHALTQQVAREEMGEARLKLLHRRAAEALAGGLGRTREASDALAGVVAQHFAEAGAFEQAAPFALRAGQHAARVAAWEEAIGLYELALKGEDAAGRRAEILAEMADAQFHRGAMAQSSESYSRALELAREQGDLALMEKALLGLTRSLYPQGRYTEAIAVSRELREKGPAEMAGAAEFAWGTSLGVESAHPVEAEAHLRAAAERLEDGPSYTSGISKAWMGYQLAAVLGQRGESGAAVAGYRRVLELLAGDEGALDITRTIMLYNNLAYHLHLLGDQDAAAGYVQEGIRYAQEKASLSHMPYLLSTSGEIALARGDLDGAEGFFREGLQLAEATPIPERVAGMTANLGRVALARGEKEEARALLEEALTQADAVGNGHLSVRIRIWLTPLLKGAARARRVREAREMAEADGYAGLLKEIEELERG